MHIGTVGKKEVGLEPREASSIVHSIYISMLPPPPPAKLMLPGMYHLLPLTTVLHML